MTRSADSIRHNDNPADWLRRSADASILATPQQAFSTDRAYDVLNFAIETMKAGLEVALCTLVEIRACRKVFRRAQSCRNGLHFHALLTF